MGPVSGYRSREGAENVIDLYLQTRREGFGPEVKRRIMLGAYVLSAGYYDAYYLKAQRVRTLLRQDFEAAFEQCDALVAPTCPTTAFKLGEKTDDPLTMYLSDIYVVATNPAGVPCLVRSLWLFQWDAGGYAIDRQAPERGRAAPDRACLPIRHRLASQNPHPEEPGSNEDDMIYEPVIGLEIHAELLTKSKMFCGCSAAYSEAPAANTLICPVCTALPGAMPVVNQKAVEQAILVGWH